MKLGLFLAAAAAVLIGAAPPVRMSEADLARSRPAEPFRIADNLYYVGTSDIAVYLFTGPEGMVLLDGGYPQSAPLVLASITRLGFDPRRIRILITRQAHFDHVGGLAALRQSTGARLYASAPDAKLLEQGGMGDFAFGDRLTFPAVKVDHVLRDGELVQLGPIRLTAHLTPGHTKGCTSWTFNATDAGRILPALFVCGATAPGYRLVGNRSYPRILDDFQRSFATWRKLDCQLFLGAHGVYFGLEAKRAAMRPGGPNPFVDPEGCRNFLDKAARAIRDQGEKQQGAK
jgi:metallo-beta-lactamase class B